MVESNVGRPSLVAYEPSRVSLPKPTLPIEPQALDQELRDVRLEHTRIAVTGADDQIGLIVEIAPSGTS